MRNRFKGKLSREKPPDPVKLVANRLFALHEAEMLAQLQAFVQEQWVRPIPSRLPLTQVSEAAVRIIEVAPMAAASRPTNGESAQKDSAVVAKADFRAWQTEVFDTGDAADDEAILEMYLHRVSGDSEQDVT